MELNDFTTLNPTLTESHSVAAFLEILTHEGWVCYTSTRSTHVDVDALANRFLRSHALVPGLVTEFTLATEPVAVWYWKEDNGETYKGGLFSNGAVHLRFGPDGSSDVMLFVAKETTQKWGYPDDFFIWPEEIRKYGQGEGEKDVPTADPKN